MFPPSHDGYPHLVSSWLNQRNSRFALSLQNKKLHLFHSINHRVYFEYFSLFLQPTIKQTNPPFTILARPSWSGEWWKKKARGGDQSNNAIRWTALAVWLLLKPKPLDRRKFFRAFRIKKASALVASMKIAEISTVTHLSFSLALSLSLSLCPWPVFPVIRQSEPSHLLFLLYVA